ncbi:cellulose synthase/poly-beta-1,6-N-acetylglucosamine synthase-like glycosyltransferase [Sediminihabitans luteus]|uniref:Cellulose synthase/poly-beta-1,6-N-acetylglucosamine synthase-like glycosyltransferase n=1 Tax=Sediminihabitans luteus TaxID=1138585 RepID=A0A2M9CYD4_9CELL|nr:glycosyltransferase family 2 protein [Sediminihabitans luteus]PJJ76946.1 cellulose synthase/poly-beta-1,6-N-acetylglucosamine synthase-like glycosyltransferase [Sediminihabitans luteus]
MATVASMTLADASAGHDPAATSAARERRADPRLRGVSVIAVVRDEGPHLRAAVRSALDQDYAGGLEVVVSVGPSHDDTREIADELAREDSRVVVLDNPTGARSTGLNAAIRAGRTDHDVVVRIDGHSVLPRDYVRRVVDRLESTGAVNVGGMMVPVGTTSAQRAVACAMSHPAGIGSAAFHTGGPAGPVDTVYLGGFRRDALLAAEGYDESLVRAEDWELNARLRARGGTVWFDPGLHVVYYPRATLRSLARQFWRTGMWRREVLRRDPRSVRLRYLAPPVLVAVLALCVPVVVLGPLLVGPWAGLGLVPPAAYLAAVTAASVHAGARQPAPVRLLLPAVLVTMHLAWGAGFWRGIDDAATREHRT